VDFSKRVLIYVRVSTSHQEQKPEVQLSELRSYCLSRKWNVVEEIVDHGYSGDSVNRPGLKQLNKLVKSRKVDAVIVFKLDRLFRSLKHMVVMLQEFSDLGVSFVSLHEQIDMTTAAGRLMLHIIAAFAEFEKDLIRERTIAGLEYARSQGKKLGRPETKDSARILELRAQGKSYRTIAKELNCSQAAVYRAIDAASKTPRENTLNTQLETRGCKGITSHSQTAEFVSQSKEVI
jgi:DNA invertase Pin-like site-specific DNA recombinase